MNKLATLLQKLFEGHDLNKAARAMGLSPKNFKDLVLQGVYELSAQQAMEIAAMVMPEGSRILTQAKEIMAAQAEDQLIILGAKDGTVAQQVETKVEAKEDKPKRRGSSSQTPMHGKKRSEASIVG